MKKHDLSSEGCRVLVAGDLDEVFSDVEALEGAGCEVCVNILDAIEAAAKERFAVIGVVVSASLGGLDSSLKTLRQVNPGAKIILLARMWEEPRAMQLVGDGGNGENLADDYLICPVSFSLLAAGAREAVKNEVKVSEDIAAVPKKKVAALVAVKDEGNAAKVRELEELATTDELTGLKNRRYIWEFGRQIIKVAGKNDGNVTVLIFDIDNFKHYNDVYGHSAGDEILKQAAVLMQECCRGHDVVGRIGGDEFAVVFWDGPKRKTATEEERRTTAAEHPTDAIFIAKRFIVELNKARFSSLGPEGEGVLSISGGLASFPRDGATIQELFVKADNALLEAKGSGKTKIYLVGKDRDDIADIE